MIYVEKKNITGMGMMNNTGGGEIPTVEYQASSPHADSLRVCHLYHSM